MDNRFMHRLKRKIPRLDRFLPGRDLVSMQFWPLQDQKDQSASRKEDIGTEEEIDAARDDPSD